MIVEMRYFVLVYLAVVAVTADQAKEGNKICEPGARFKDDCNDCHCSNDGKSRVCTMMLCPQQDTPILRSRRQADEVNEAEEEKKICEPGARFKEDCNDCHCSNDGKSRVCTQMLCPPQDTSSLRTRRQAHQSIDGTTTCEPGSSWTEDCNTCRCSDDGKYHYCTLMLCPSHYDSLSRSHRQITSQSNVAKSILGTHRPEQVPNNDLLRQRRQVSHNRECVPGETFKIYCNTCSCGSDGFSVACTRRACDENVYNADGSLKNAEQVPNNALLRQRRQVSHNRECVPGETFKIYCNSCTCGTDAFSVACTRMACPKGVYNEDGSLKNVQQVPNNSLLRRRRQVSHNRECVPGESFKIYCNTCTCGSDGFSVACTRKGCNKNVYNEDGTLKNAAPVTNSPLMRRRRQVSHDRECVPGESFKIYCNTCTCGSDGFSVACTRKGCSKNVYNEDGTLKNAAPVTNSPLLRRRRAL